MKTIKKVPIVVKFVNVLPFDEIEADILYVNKNEMRMRHLCLCGCKRMIDIPLQIIDDNGQISRQNNNGWSLTVSDECATVTPSILNNPCGGHYIITRGIANLV